MLISLVCVLLPLASAPSREPAPTALAQPPEVLFKDLFVAVQTAGIFSDGKTFPDAVPQAAPAAILAAYHAAHPHSPAALRHFVEERFTLPAQAVTTATAPEKVSVATTSPPTMGSVVPVAARTTAGMREK